MPRCTRALLAVLATLATVAVAQPPAALAAVDIVPFVGLLHPVESQVNDLSGGGLLIEVGSGPAYGMRVDWWLNERFGIEGSLSAAATELTLQPAFVSSATWWTGDLRARLRILGGNWPVRLDALAGIGLQNLDSAAKDILATIEVDTESQMSWILGLAMDVPVGSSLGLRVELADYVHDVNFESDPAVSPVEIDDHTQHDLMFSIGLVVPLSGR